MNQLYNRDKILKKNVVLFFILITVVLPLPINAQDGEWEHFFTNSAGDRFYYDRGNIVHPSDPFVRVRLRVSGSSREGAVPQQLWMLVEINCSKQMYRRLEQQMLNNDGTIRALLQPSEWIDVLPQSNMEALADKVCKKSIGRRQIR
jgi:hypothetical protein